MNDGWCDVCELPSDYLLHVEHADPKRLTLSQKRALAVFADATGRSGIDNAFDEIDEDTIEEILREWVRLIEEEEN